MTERCTDESHKVDLDRIVRDIREDKAVNVIGLLVTNSDGLIVAQSVGEDIDLESLGMVFVGAILTNLDEIHAIQGLPMSEWAFGRTRTGWQIFIKRNPRYGLEYIVIGRDDHPLNESKLRSIEERFESDLLRYLS